jgi:hypothetical protein
LSSETSKLVCLKVTYRENSRFGHLNAGSIALVRMGDREAILRCFGAALIDSTGARLIWYRRVCRIDLGLDGNGLLNRNSCQYNRVLCSEIRGAGGPPGRTSWAAAHLVKRNCVGRPLQHSIKQITK